MRIEELTEEPTMTDPIKISREHLPGLLLALKTLGGFTSDEVGDSAYIAIEELIAQAKSATPPADAADMGGQAGDEVEVAQYQYLSRGDFARWWNIEASDVAQAKAEGFTVRALVDVAQHRQQAGKLVEALRNLRIARSLTSVPLKLAFAKERGLEGIDEVHDWMTGAHRAADEALAEWEKNKPDRQAHE